MDLVLLHLMGISPHFSLFYIATTNKKKVFFFLVNIETKYSQINGTSITSSSSIPEEKIQKKMIYIGKVYVILTYFYNCMSNLFLLLVFIGKYKDQSFQVCLCITIVCSGVKMGLISTDLNGPSIKILACSLFIDV